MAKLQWYYPPRRGVNPDLVYQTIVRSNPGVGKSTLRAASPIAARATSILTPHNLNSDKTRAPGESRSSISVSRGARGVDAFVSLEDSDGGAWAIEGKLRPLRGAIDG